jgi:hypothetical protein
LQWHSQWRKDESTISVCIVNKYDKCNGEIKITSGVGVAAPMAKARTLVRV